LLGPSPQRMQPGCSASANALLSLVRAGFLQPFGAHLPASFTPPPLPANPEEAALFLRLVRESNTAKEEVRCARV